MTLSLKPLYKAFTLIELLITLSIVAIVLGLAIPSLTNRVQKESAGSTTQKMFHILHFARMEAIKRNQNVIVCGTSDFKSCSHNWSHGMMAYVDFNKDGSFNEQDLVLRVNKPNSNLTQIDSGKVNTIKYAGNGRCLTRCTINIKTKEKLRNTIVLYDSGRARIEYYG
tara:strand:+ start:45676 stop:46179 length:504 start_codon:yes stop_codon:yes gene_type:complete